VNIDIENRMLNKKIMNKNRINLTEQKEIWDNLSHVWKRYTTPPARHCQGLLKIWEKVIKEIAKKVKNPKALILGSTPELRDLVLRYNFESIACDINPNMLEAMDKLMKYKDHPQNKKVAGDWLKMNFKKHSLDIVLGHQAIEQLFNTKEVKILFNQLRFFLKPEGLFLICAATRENKKPGISGNDRAVLFNKYKKQEICECELHHFLKYNSDWNTYNNSPSLMGTLPVYKKIKQLSKQNKAVKKFYSWWEKALGNNNKKVLIFLRKDLEKLFKQYFKLLPIEQCDDFTFCKYMPSYLGRPRKDFR